MAPAELTLARQCEAKATPPERHCCTLVEGSGPHLTQETESLLRRRLRASGLVLFVACAVYVVRSFFQDALDLCARYILITATNRILFSADIMIIPIIINKS